MTEIEYVHDLPPSRTGGPTDPTIDALIAAARGKPGTWASVAVDPDDYKRLRNVLSNRVQNPNAKLHGSGLETAGRTLPDGECRLYARFPEDGGAS